MANISIVPNFVPDTLLSASPMSPRLVVTTPWNGHWYDHSPFFTDEENEAQRDSVRHPRSHRPGTQAPRPWPGSKSSQDASSCTSAPLTLRPGGETCSHITIQRETGEAGRRQTTSSRGQAGSVPRKPGEMRGLSFRKQEEPPRAVRGYKAGFFPPRCLVICSLYR